MTITVEQCVPFWAQMAGWGYAVTGDAGDFSTLVSERGGESVLLVRYGCRVWDKTRYQLNQTVFIVDDIVQPNWRFAIAGTWLGEMKHGR